MMEWTLLDVRTQQDIVPANQLRIKEENDLKTIRPGDFLKTIIIELDTNHDAKRIQPLWIRVTGHHSSNNGMYYTGHIVTELNPSWPLQQFDEIQIHDGHIVDIRHLDPHEREEYRFEALSVHHKLPTHFGDFMRRMIQTRRDCKAAEQPLPLEIVELEQEVIEEMRLAKDMALDAVRERMAAAWGDFEGVMGTIH